MVERKHIKKTLKVVLFFILCILYYFLYMESALSQYFDKRTTIVESRKDILNSESPILILCPDPPFKASYFRNQSLNKIPFLERYFWMMPASQDLVQNGTAKAIDIYMNMSYILGSDFYVFVHHNDK